MRPEEAAYEAEFTGETQAAAGLVDVEALTSVLSCVGCDLGCSLPLTSCRKAWRDIVKPKSNPLSQVQRVQKKEKEGYLRVFGEC